MTTQPWPGPPIRVEGGLKARGTRGSLGEQWWSRRFVDLLEQLCDGGRLARGRAYARQGQVLGFDLTPGQVIGQVQGSRPQPYTVKINLPPYADATWDAIVAALGSAARYRAALLAGEMPHEIVEVCEAVGAPLFPATLDMTCSCPDSGWPCKHLSAVLYLLAEAFDDDPFLVLAWRGRDQRTLLDAVRATGPAATTPTQATSTATTTPETSSTRGSAPSAHQHLADARADSNAIDATAYYQPAISLARLRERIATAPAAPPELLLRALEPPPVTVRHIPLVDILRAPYRALADGSQLDPKD